MDARRSERRRAMELLWDAKQVAEREKKDLLGRMHAEYAWKQRKAEKRLVGLRERVKELEEQRARPRGKILEALTHELEYVKREMVEVMAMREEAERKLETGLEKLKGEFEHKTKGSLADVETVEAGEEETEMLKATAEAAELTLGVSIFPVAGKPDEEVEEGDSPFVIDTNQSLVEALERHLGKPRDHIPTGCFRRLPVTEEPAHLDIWWPKGPALKLAASEGIYEEKALLHGQPLAELVRRAVSAWKEQPVLVYEDEDFVSEQGGVCDAELLCSCRGRPVFTPDVSDDEEFARGWLRKVSEPEQMTREWARKTVQVLASDEILRPQILAGKLRFLGQPLSLVVEGARAEGRVFVEEDFDGPLKVRLRELLVGRPVFLPEEGCEYALAFKKRGRKRGQLAWGSALALLIDLHPELLDGIVSGSVPVDGRRWTEIQLPPLPVWNEEPSMPCHLFGDCEMWRRSYSESRTIRVADFPQWKPDWAGEVTQENYLRLLRVLAETPAIAGGCKLGSGDSQSGCYNEKHHRLHRLVENMTDD